MVRSKARLIASVVGMALALAVLAAQPAEAMIAPYRHGATGLINGETYGGVGCQITRYPTTSNSYVDRAITVSSMTVLAAPGYNANYQDVRVRFWLSYSNGGVWRNHSDLTGWFASQFVTTTVNGQARYGWRLPAYDWNNRIPGHYAAFAEIQWLYNGRYIGSMVVAPERKDIWTMANNIPPYPTVANTPAGTAGYCTLPT